MTKSERMKPVVDVASGREQKAAKELGEYNRILEEKGRRLAELESYRGEYVKYFHELGGNGATAQKLNELRRFMATLDTAIEQQRSAVEQARQACEAKRVNWQLARSKTMAVEKVVTRYQEEEQLVADKNEQKAIDEIALQKGIAKRLRDSEE